METVIREATEADIVFLARFMREEDRKEAYALSGHHRVLEQLETSRKRSTETLVGVSPTTNLPGVIFGAAVIENSQSAAIWAMGTSEIQENPVRFLRASRYVLRKWFEDYNITSMWNFTHDKNKLHHKWLKWCHAELFAPVPHGPFGHKFRPFIIKRQSYV